MQLRFGTAASTGDAVFDQHVRTILGDRNDPIADVAARAATQPSDFPVVAWEADPLLYRFNYVSPVIVDVLGYPLAAWTDEYDFWLQRVVHGGDRADVIAICALSAGRHVDCSFRYRALARDGSVVVMHTALVTSGPAKRGVPMRGLMIERSREAHSGPGAGY